MCGSYCKSEDMTILSLNRRLAVLFGILVPLGETIRRWGVWGYLPSWLDDYLVGAFLLFGAYRSRCNAQTGQKTLAAAWGFFCGMFYLSFFGHLKTIHEPDPGNIPQITLTILIGLAFLGSILGLVTSLLENNRSGR